MSKLGLCYLDGNTHLVTCGATYTPWRIRQAKIGTEVYNVNTKEVLPFTTNPAIPGQHRRQYALSQLGETDKLLSDLEHYVWLGGGKIK
jgi:hypothetical protein|tara:strand:- start:479 stop:745 length:267 start_codon:yes stop_codon:yes gene_type:complete